MILAIGHFGNTKFEALRNARVGYGDSRSVMHMFVKFYKLNNYIAYGLYLSNMQIQRYISYSCIFFAFFFSKNSSANVLTLKSNVFASRLEEATYWRKSA